MNGKTLTVQHAVAAAKNANGSTGRAGTARSAKLTVMGGLRGTRTGLTLNPFIFGLKRP